MYEDYIADPDQVQAAQTLGITQIIDDMMAANAEVNVAKRYQLIALE